MIKTKELIPQISRCRPTDIGSAAQAEAHLARSGATIGLKSWFSPSPLSHSIWQRRSQSETIQRA